MTLFPGEFLIVNHVSWRVPCSLRETLFNTLVTLGVCSLVILIWWVHHILVHSLLVQVIHPSTLVVEGLSHSWTFSFGTSGPYLSSLVVIITLFHVSLAWSLRQFI